MAVLRTNFLSRSMGRQVDINVIIPTYAFRHNASQINPYDPSQKFKVLILLHGFSGDCNDYLTFTSIARYAEKANLAVIMPSGCNSGYVDDPNGAKMHSFIAHELLEVCAFLFPISTKREDVYIGGLSMGAMGASRIALAHPETFSEVLMMSGAISPLKETSAPMNWFGNDSKYYNAPLAGGTLDWKNTQEDPFYNAEKNIKEGKQLPRFMITVGTEDHMLEACRNFHHFLEELGYDTSLSEVPDFGHEWDFWEKEIQNAIEHGFTL